MSRVAKILLGVLTVLPVAYMAFFMFTVMSSMSNPEFMSGPAFEQLMVMHFAVMFLNFGLIAFYMVHALTKNRALQEQSHRVLWALLLFMGNIIAMPIYYVMYVLPDSSDPISDS